MIYILDTNIISYIIKNRVFSLIDKFETISKEHTIGVSSITVAELYYGVRKRGSQKLEALVTNNVKEFERVENLVIENWI
ncbi:MAG: type II toxin-antitoxin system VapC family toxin [Campylobacterales bacterium]